MSLSLKQKQKMNNDILRFINDHKIKTNKNDSIEFREHKFLLDILRDESKVIVVQKCVQAGVSFTFELKTLYAGIKEALNILYVLPSAKDARDFVVSKFDPVVEGSRIREYVKKTGLGKTNVWNTALKKIGNSFFFFRGAQSETGAQSIDGDIIVNDEYDFQPVKSRKMFQERLEGSKSKGINYCIGYPILESSGINEMFENSDKKEWFVTCPHCKKRQVLEWPLNIDRVNGKYICAECQGELSNEDRMNGVWIPTNPNGKISGYHISKMMLSWVTADKLVKKFSEDPPKHFYNYTLGLPYSGDSSEINKEAFDKAKVDYREFGKFKKDSYKIVGIDQGNRFHYCEGIVSPRGCVITNIRIIDEEADLFTAIEQYTPDKLVVDMSPNRWTALRIQEKFGTDKVWLANIRLWAMNKISKSHLRHFELKRSIGIVNVERTESIQEMINGIVRMDLLFLNDIPTLEDVYIHLKNMVPKIEMRQGTARKVYKRAGVGDDYGFAVNLFYVGAKIAMPDPDSFLENKKDSGDIKNVGLEMAVRKMLGEYNDNSVVVIKRKK